jgi:hypothetical protein
LQEALIPSFIQHIILLISLIIFSLMLDLKTKEGFLQEYIYF